MQPPMIVEAHPVDVRECRNRRGVAEKRRPSASDDNRPARSTAFGCALRAISRTLHPARYPGRPFGIKCVVLPYNECRGV